LKLPCVSYPASASALTGDAKPWVWGANGRRVSRGRFRVVGCGAFRLDFDGGLGGVSVFSLRASYTSILPNFAFHEAMQANSAWNLFLSGLSYFTEEMWRVGGWPLGDLPDWLDDFWPPRWWPHFWRTHRRWRSGGEFAGWFVMEEKAAERFLNSLSGIIRNGRENLL
jgi:hypothetical protein